MTDKIVVMSACASNEDAVRIARELIAKRLAACVNIVAGARSVYRWKGEVTEESEVLLVIKSSRELFAKLRAELEQLHTYEVPEVIALAVVDGSERYLEWVDRELSAGQDS